MTPSGTHRPPKREHREGSRLSRFCGSSKKNRVLYRDDGSHLVDNNTLVALALMIAESRTEEKEIMTVVVNLINRND